LKEIIDGGNVEVIESEDNSIIDKHDRLSVDEYKTKFKEGIDTQNSNLAESIADEWIDEYPRDYEGHYAYVIANIDGDIEDLKRHMAFAFACTPPNEFNKSKFEKEAKLAIVLRYGFYEANLK
jgi:hypothetical protein